MGRQKKHTKYNKKQQHFVFTGYVKTKLGCIKTNHIDNGNTYWFIQYARAWSNPPISQTRVTQISVWRFQSDFRAWSTPLTVGCIIQDSTCSSGTIFAQGAVPLCLPAGYVSGYRVKWALEICMVRKFKFAFHMSGDS